MSPDPPKFRTKPQDVATEIGSSVVLNCDVDGQPQPEIKWLSEITPGQIEVSEYHDDKTYHQVNITLNLF